MKNIYLFYIVFQVLKVLLINICKIQSPDLLFPFAFTSAGTVHETRLFRSAELFRTYTNFMTAIAQITKVIKLNHLYLYDIQLITLKLSFRSMIRLLFLFMVSNEDQIKAKKARMFLYFLPLIFYLQHIGTGWDLTKQC